jgi:hypothetical protein
LFQLYRHSCFSDANLCMIPLHQGMLYLSILSEPVYVSMPSRILEQFLLFCQKSCFWWDFARKEHFLATAGLL